jgi:hypothetical protein
MSNEPPLKAVIADHMIQDNLSYSNRERNSRRGLRYYYPRPTLHVQEHTDHSSGPRPLSKQLGYFGDRSKSSAQADRIRHDSSPANNLFRTPGVLSKSQTSLNTHNTFRAY